MQPEMAPSPDSRPSLMLQTKPAGTTATNVKSQMRKAKTVACARRLENGVGQKLQQRHITPSGLYSSHESLYKPIKGYMHLLGQKAEGAIQRALRRRNQVAGEEQ